MYAATWNVLLSILITAGNHWLKLALAAFNVITGHIMFNQKSVWKALSSLSHIIIILTPSLFPKLIRRVMLYLMTNCLLVLGYHTYPSLFLNLRNALFFIDSENNALRKFRNNEG